MIRAALVIGLLALPADAADRYICWQGAGGYTMTGQFSFPDALLNRTLIDHEDLTAFRIVGYLDGNVIGKWSMADATDATSWLLRYSPRTGLFPLQGFDGLYQMWNANGEVNDCGTPGFGFNAGNGGQDICIDDRFILASSIPPETPLRSFSRPQSTDCAGIDLLGKQAVPVSAVE